ncbi:MAG TPA: methyl-accepting chemotaxis protein, partial [Aquabacterium sp.]|nr:methyl-accepting chemotaxis protein [Aquabacterium sp.]
RHPDMPPEAFADMWRTLKGGESWTALVKNRCKNGDFYWVRANVTPVRRDGQITGYMSVRTRPSREEVAQAEVLYRDFREGRVRGRAFHKGVIVHTGVLGAWRSWGQRLTVRWRMRAALAAILIGALLAAALLPAWGPWAAPLGVVMVALATGAWLERRIAAPLDIIQTQALAVAAGQPCHNCNLTRVDELGMILRAVNQAGLNLRSLVDDVNEQAHGLRQVSHEIATGNTDLSSRTEQTASSLEQTAASMEQLSATVKNNADSARQATDLAATASSVAGDGGAVVAEVVATMDDITASSARIADIIGVIDGISFQTNILALNAAVEAARAGEQGRGFAVVAGEVRSLAHRSAEAAKEIKSLIGSSVDRIDAGAGLVQKAGRSMNDIVAQVQRVSALMQAISSASADQSNGIDQVACAVTELDQLTQQNAALVQQSASATAALRHRAERLVDAVGVYRA